uniref:Phospholipase B-like n=1 Tax=Centruroides hentzi TaxID=88313 RepID=A0A2I9LPG8_9SCOR
MILLFVIAAFLPCILSSQEKNASVVWDANSNKFLIRDSIVNNSVAWGSFKDQIAETGWSLLEVHTNASYNDSFQAYAAGLVEGYLTADLISKHWNNLYENYCKNDQVFCKKLQNFLEINMNFMNKQIQRKRSHTYWHQVALVLEQVQGLEDGYKKTPSLPNTNPNVMGVMFFNFFGDLEDLEALLNKTTNKKLLGSGHCSGLIKLLKNHEDLYVAQDSWNTYQSMLRILKKYVFPFKTSPSKKGKTIPGHTMSFSSYPGTVFSGDDFYIISTRLVALETTIGNSNTSLFKYIQPEKIVLEWIRNIVSNRLATSGLEWASLFKLFNSGTYNNQWMIVDFNKFSPGTVSKKGLLIVLEQLPNCIEYADKTELLLSQGYWPSYNSPSFPKIFNMSGTQEMVKKYGDWFSYDKTPRALIFKRDQGNVDDLTSMTKIMRYNDFKKDPLSRCNCTPPYSAENAIAARSDLNPANGTYPFSALGHRAHGAIDMKLTSYSLQKGYQFIAYAGPTYDQQPPFQWSKSDFINTPHQGHPDLWKFSPLVHHWLDV